MHDHAPSPKPTPTATTSCSSHRDDVRGADLAALARTLCARHTGVGGDGLIVYAFTPDGATMRLINADGSPSELSGNGLRCLAALVMRERERARRHRRGVSTEVARRHRRRRAPSRAGLAQPTAATCSARRWGSRHDLQQETLDGGGRVAGRRHARHRQPAVRGAACRRCRIAARFERLGPGLWRRIRDSRPAPTSSSRWSRRRPRAHPHLGARRRSDRGVGHRRVCGGDHGDAVRRRGARRRGGVAGRHPARRMDARRRLPHRLGRDSLRRHLAATGSARRRRAGSASAPGGVRICDRPKAGGVRILRRRRVSAARPGRWRRRRRASWRPRSVRSSGRRRPASGRQFARSRRRPAPWRARRRRAATVCCARRRAAAGTRLASARGQTSLHVRR